MRPTRHAEEEPDGEAGDTQKVKQQSGVETENVVSSMHYVVAHLFIEK